MMDFNYQSVEQVEECKVIEYKGVYNRYIKRIIELLLSIILVLIYGLLS